MNTRQRKLLQILLSNPSHVFHVQDFTVRLDCSEKTVRNDLQFLENFLRESAGASLIRKPGVGIYMEIGQAEKKELLDKLFVNEPVTEEERVIEIAYQLLISDKPMTLTRLSEKYYVSKAMIKKDLAVIEQWLQRFQLKLTTKERVGSFLEGTEINKRIALAHLSELIPSMLKGKKFVLNLFLPYEVTIVKKALQELSRQFPIDFTDDAMESLLVHSLIMVKRTRQKTPVTILEEEKKVKERPEYTFATWFFDKLEKTLKLKFPEDERIYFTWHLISSKRKGDVLERSQLNSEELQAIVHRLMERVGNIMLVDFHQDHTLKDGLTIHMHAVINRIKYGFPITNPLLGEIKKMYPYMFNMVMLTLDDIKQDYHLDIPEDEAAYLVLHFQAAIERLEGNRKNKKRAVIVCHMGIGMSNLLAAKMEQHFHDIEIVSVIGKADVAQFLQSQPIDFVISTVALEKVNVPTVVVSPLLEAKDKRRLAHFIQEWEQKPLREKSSTSLNAVLHEDLIFVGVDKEHRYEVIEMLGNALVATGFVAETYPHHALKRERKSATAIGGGIAIPHGSPSLINKSAVAIAVLKKPLEWGRELVSVVFMLALANDTPQLARGVVGEIAKISENEAMVQQMLQAKEEKEIVQLLRGWDKIRNVK